MAIINIDDVKKYANIKDGVDVAVLTAIVAAANAAVLSYLNRNIEAADYTERYDGTNSDVLVPDNLPILSVDTVKVNGRVLSRTDLSQLPWNGYDFDGNSIFLHGGEKFYRGRRNVEVTYRAGFNEVPEGVKQAGVYIASQMYKRRDRIGVTSKSIGPETISYSTNDLDASAKMLLNDYRRVWLTS